MSKIDLKPGLDFKATLSLVVGTVIGTGVFLKAAIMTQAMGAAPWVLLVWLVAGLLSLAGALCFAELGCRFPRAGGEYVYLLEAYGELPAFLNGWMRFCIGNPGSIAAYAVGFSTFLSGALPVSSTGQTAIAVVTILVFTAINCATVKAAGFIQAAMTGLKLALIVGLAALILSRSSLMDWNKVFLFNSEFPGWKAFGSAMLAALWAYDGWNGMPMAASEVIHPKKNIPRGLIVGMVAVISIYCLLNAAYFLVLPVGEVESSYSPKFLAGLPVATKAAQVALGPMAVFLVSLVLSFSALVSLNGSTLTGARIPFAMAKDRLFFQGLASVNPRTHAPVTSVVIQGSIATILALTGTFDQLTDYVMFASWIFYGMAIWALFILRKNQKDYQGFKAPLFPLLPALFLFVTAGLIANTLITATTQSLTGLALIALGIPFFVYFKRNK